ncbi:MAG: hypothetical protein WKF50_04705 [Nocardioides sp.]
MDARLRTGSVVLALSLAVSTAATAGSAAAPTKVARASVAPDGGQLDEPSRLSEVTSLSAHGERVAFQTPASLVPEDTNGEVDVYLRDLVAGTTTLVTVDATGAAVGGGSASTSQDGNRVAFLSDASLAPQDSDDDLDAYVRTLDSQTTVLVSAPKAGVAGRGEIDQVELSGDGSTAVLLTAQRLLRKDTDPRDVDGFKKLDVYAANVNDSRLRLVSVDRGGRSFAAPVGLGGVSFDASRIGFHTPLTIGGVPGGFWVYYAGKPRTRLVWREDLRRLSFALPGTPAVSGNGRFVALVSALPRVDDEGRPRQLDLLRLDLRTGRTVVVCCGEGTRYADAYQPLLPVLAGGGRRIAFELESGAVAGDDAPGEDVYLVDLATGPRLRLVSRGADGPSNDASGVRGHSISADGQHVAFTTDDDDLVAGDTNGVHDVFVWSDAS